jgi:hypothetical protein
MNDAATLISGAVRPKAGDLVLARVDVLGHHRKLESPAGRRAKLYPGDEILLLYGNRYATDQFEAIIPDNLGPCNMVAGGGIAARAVLSNSNARQPTIIEPLGLVGDCDGMPLNLRTYAEPTPRLMPEDTLGTSHMPAKRTARVIVVVGTSMNAGKTTMAASLIKGLARGGYKVGAGKVTGTGAGGDRWSVTDAGANQIIDFTDFGYPSTYLLSDQTLARLFADICDALCNGGNDYVVLEIADGLFFPETSGLVQAPEFHQRVDDVMLAASDAMGASAGVRFLAEKNLGVYAIGGKITASPLAAREAGRVIDVQFVSSHELASPDWAFPAAT